MNEMKWDKWPTFLGSNFTLDTVENGQKSEINYVRLNKLLEIVPFGYVAMRLLRQGRVSLLEP